MRQRLATARVTNLIRNAIVALVGWLPRWLVTTASEHVASPSLTWLTGPTKQLSRSRPSLHVDTKHWIRPTASNLVKFGPYALFGLPSLTLAGQNVLSPVNIREGGAVGCQT